MADFKKSLKLILSLEFNSPKNALHKNPGEDGYTFCGIYQKANPSWSGWNKINDIIKKVNNNQGLTNENIKQASEIAYNNTDLMKLVEDLYKEKYWSNSLEQLNQTAVDEIMVFGVNAGMKTAIKKAQKVANVLQDGLLGQISINAINNIPEEQFDMKFDEVEISYYNSLIENKPSFAIFKNGWHNRAKAV